MKKRKYLFRLAAVFILMLMVPAVIFYHLFWRHSFQEMEAANEIYYQEVLDSSISLYEESMRDLIHHIALINVGSKKSDSVFWKIPVQEQETFYWLYQAMMELRETYNRYDVRNWGIYIYDMDKMIMPSSVMSSDQFLDMLGAEEQNEGAEEFFSVEQYHPSKMLFETTNTTDKYDGCLMVGGCTALGADHIRALVCYVISPKNMEDWMMFSDSQGIEYCLADHDENRILLSWGHSMETSWGEVLAKVGGGEVFEQDQNVLYAGKCDFLPLSFVMHITEDSLQKHMSRYFYEAKHLLVVTAAILLIICFAALFVAYKPVYQLTSALENSGDGEFEVIKNELDVRHFKMQEQEAMIMELLLNHLVYGVPVSGETLCHLGVDASFCNYCVFLLEGYVLLSSEVELLTKEIEEKFLVRLFVTDWEGEKQSILILFLKESDTGKLYADVIDWMERRFIADSFLYAGKVVDKLDDIQLSLRSCLNQRKKANVDGTLSDSKKMEQEKLKNSIMAYLESNYRNSDLSQVHVADIFGISSYTLSRMFKNQVGIGFADYIISRRLEYAKDLLLTTSYSIGEISAMSGFSSENHFSRTFKGHVGVTPSSYRRQ